MDRQSSSTTDDTASESASNNDSLSTSEQRALIVLRDQVNKLVKESEGRQDAIATKLFTGLTDGRPESVLGPDASPSLAYSAMAEMCGESLRINRAMLSRAVRIGALNAHYRSGPWHQLDWAAKVELLPLLGSDMNVRRLDSGITAAIKPETSTRDIRQWVAEHLPKGEKADGRPKAISAAAAARIFETGRRLKLVSARRMLAERLRRYEPAAFNAAVSDLKATIKHLPLLQEELAEE